MMMIAFTLVGFGMLLTLVRGLKGESFGDRVVAVDTFNIMIVGVIGLYAVFSNEMFFMDVAIVYAILAFVETIVLAKVLEGRKS
jgi:multicomponent Na+:H+ antiporter subunit F